MIASTMTPPTEFLPSPPSRESLLTTAHLEAKIAEIVAFGELAQESDLFAWESAESEAIRVELVPDIERTCRRVLALLTDLGTELDTLVDDGGAGGLDLAEAELARDTVWLARMELDRRVGQLAAVRQLADDWTVLSHAEACLHQLMVACANVELRLAPLAGLESRLPSADDLSRSVRVRVAYADVRRRLDGVRDLDLGRRLHRAADLVDELVGDDLYRRLRVSDRGEFRHLQVRLRAWVRLPLGEGFDATRHAEAGEHLWQDLVGFSALLHQVNRRAELIEHDQRLAAEMLAELGREPGGEPPGDAELARLQNLDGRDPEIDALLRDSAPRTAWIDRLERLVRLEPTGRATLPEAL